MNKHKEKSFSELTKELETNRKAVQDIRFGSSGSQTRNVKEISTRKKEIARILTELKRREITLS